MFTEATHLDNLVDFPRKIISYILQSQEVVALLNNKPNTTVEDMEDNNGDNMYVYDYDYVDDTTQEEKAYICLDVYPVTKNSHIEEVTLAINVICHKNYMSLNRQVFKVKGNRRDNLMRYIDKQLNGNKDFGIGSVELQDIGNIAVPKNYTGRCMIYKVFDFNRKSK